MIGAQHRPQIAYGCAASFDAFLVKIVAEHIHAVGPADIVQTIAVEIGYRDAGRRCYERSRLEVAAHEAAELKRHPIARGKVEVGYAAGQLRGLRRGFLETLGEQVRQSSETGAARGEHVGRRCVDCEELRLIVFIERHPCGEAARDARMTSQRAMLGARQLQPDLEFAQHQHPRQRGNRIAKSNDDVQILA
jgi:hypothetical protein